MTFHNHRTPHLAAARPAARGLPGPVTLAIRAMRADLDPPAPVGPVTDAIRTMRAAVVDLDADPDVRALRRGLAARIEADLAVLDMLGGDPDLEPSLGACEPVITAYMQTGPGGIGYHPGDQERWAHGALDDREDDAGDNREEENEHGGDIQDEPHDEEPDAEPSLCGLIVSQPHVGGDDREHDAAELSGIGDLDGLCEAHMPPSGLAVFA